MARTSYLPPRAKPNTLFCQTRPTSNAFFNGIDMFGMGVEGSDQPTWSDVRPLDAHQQIIEIMRDTSGQGSDGFHFLTLVKLVF